MLGILSETINNMKIKSLAVALLLLLTCTVSLFLYYYTGRNRANIAFATSLAESPIGYLRAKGKDYIKPEEFTSLLNSSGFKISVFGAGSYGADVFIFNQGEYSLLTRCKALGEYRFVAYRKKEGEMVPLKPSEAEILLTENASYRFWITKDRH
jgi:hypothetical protein